MRLFVGLDLTTGIQETLGKLIERLRPAAPVRWSTVANLHITTKFVGEWPQPRLGEITAALAGVHGPEIDIAIRGLGWFPNPHSPRVFFAAVRAPESLRRLAGATSEALEGIGIAKETRDYSPHLTLARIEERTGLAELRRAVAALDCDDFGRFTASQFHLYLSQPGPGGSVYSTLASFPLDKS